MHKFLSADKKVPVIFIIMFSLFLWGSQYVLRDLWEPDEARYTYVAKEMYETNNWSIPQRNGEFYAHKPPLMFWLIHASAQLTGGKFNGLSGRLPTLLGAILSFWALSRLAAAWYDNKTAWRAFFILSTSSLFWQKGGMGQIDMLLLGLTLSALHYLFESEKTDSPTGRITAFSLMGCAILAKGPVGLIVPCGIYVTANCLAGEKKKVLKKYWLWGIPLALLWPALWLLLAYLDGAPKEYFDELLFKQNVGRFKGEFGGHVKPFYYYLKYLVIDFLPWTLFIPAATALLIKEKNLRKQTLKLTGWILFVIIFFSISSSKRNLYIFSVYPAASILLASVMPRMKDLPQKWIKGAVYPLLILFLLMALGGAAALYFISLPASYTVFIPNLMIFFLGSVLLFLLFRRNGLTQKWFHLLIGIMIISELCVGSIVFPAFNKHKTPVALAEAVKKNVPETNRLLLYKMNGEILALYSDRQGKRIDDIQDLLKEMDQSIRGVVVFSKGKWDRLKETLKNRGTTHGFQMGHKKMVWLEYVKKSANQ